MLALNMGLFAALPACLLACRLTHPPTHKTALSKQSLCMPKRMLTSSSLTSITKYCCNVLDTVHVCTDADNGCPALTSYQV